VVTLADVFISHSSKDAKIAMAVCTALEASGIQCWIAPRDVPPGAEYADVIIEGINRTRFLVLIYSASANQSRQVKAEVQTAFESGRTIIPFRIEDMQPTGAMKHYISTFQWVDAFRHPIKARMKELANSIRTQMTFPAAMDAKAKWVSSPKIDAEISDGTSYPGEAKPLFRLSQRLILIPLLIIFALFIAFLYLPFSDEQDDDIGEVLDALAVVIETAIKPTGPKYNLAAKTDKTIYAPEDNLDLTISVDDDCYLYLVNIYYGGDVELIYPNILVEDNFLGKGKNLTMQDIAGENGLRIDADSAGGTEYIWVIASPIQLPFEDLFSKETSGDGASGEPIGPYDTQGKLRSISEVIIAGCDALYESGNQADAGILDAVSDRSITVKVVKYHVRDI
jgi:hypothetical protein